MSATVVAQAKRELQAAGVDLTGPCGAFAIANLTAMKLGLGVLDKPQGNNCRGYAADIVAAKDGRIWDCLIDGGGLNEPTWDEKEPVDKERYRPPVGMAEPPVPPVVPPPVTPPAGESSFEVDVRGAIGRIEQEQAAQKATLGQLRNAEPAVPPKDPPDYETSVLGRTVTSRPKK